MGQARGWLMIMCLWGSVCQGMLLAAESLQHPEHADGKAGAGTG